MREASVKPDGIDRTVLCHTWVNRCLHTPMKFSLASFEVLSIGQRGVGKTIFLAGSYAELHSDSPQAGRFPLWFDCSDGRSQQDLDNVLQYVEHKGKYPPATMRVTSFDFDLKQKALLRPATLCHFRMRDLPGEMCHLADLDFRNLVLNSHGCCICIDGPALLHSDAYTEAIKDIFNQVLLIASLTCCNRLEYPFAVVATKCDLLTDGEGEAPPALREQLLKKLEPLTVHLQTFEAKYAVFTSAIPIVHDGSVPRLKPVGSAAPLLWLVQELNRVHEPDFYGRLLRWVWRFVPGSRPTKADRPAPLRDLLGSRVATLSEPR
jgi:hypothetical protein